MSKDIGECFMLIQKGDNSEEVLKWQRFLTSKGFIVGALDGIFGSNVETATKSWQARNGLDADGKVGDKSWDKAFNPTAPKTVLPASSSAFSFPPKPNFNTPSANEVNQMFGKFEWKPKGSSEITILGDWVSKNIVSVKLEMLLGVPFAPKDGVIQFHRLAVPQLLKIDAEIREKGLQHLILSFGGAFYPRKIRGSNTALSNHSHGTAIDINAPENWLGQEPAKLGQKGCLYALVPIFNKYGFFWGGHYNNRKDGMHLEVAQLLN